VTLKAHSRGTGAARPQGNPDWAVEFHPLESSAVHGALFRQTTPIILTGVVRNPTKKK